MESYWIDGVTSDMDIKFVSTCISTSSDDKMLPTGHI